MTELEEDIKQRLEELRAIRRRKRKVRNLIIGSIGCGVILLVGVGVFTIAKKEYKQNFSSDTNVVVNIDEAKLDPSVVVLAVWNYLTDNPSRKETDKSLSRSLANSYDEKQNQEPYNILKGVDTYDDYNFENDQLMFLSGDYWYYFTVKYNGKGTKIYDILFDKKISRDSYNPYIVEGL